MPDGRGPFPAILEYLPYRKRDGTAPRDETTHTVFAESGYACVRVDIAGTGDSDGTFDDEYSEQELSDGEAVLAWIASQDWCNGQLGMIGISWGGFNGLQLAYRQPEALKAVVSVASTVDRYSDDIHFMDGCLLCDNFNWASQMFAYQSRPLDPELRDDHREEWIRRMATLPFMAADWLKHPHRDAFWKHGSVCEDYQRIKVPVLAMTGWADSYVNTPVQLVENLAVPAKALIGAWEHRYAHLSRVNPSDFHSEVIRWFDRWLKGEENGAENLPDYRTFMQEHGNPTPMFSPRSGTWIAEAQWPSAHISRKVLYLGQDRLDDAAQTGTVPVSTPAHIGQACGSFYAGSLIENELPGDQAEDDALSVCFDTRALEAPLELMGRARLHISFTADQPVAQLVARLCDVSPQGVSQRISFRAFNLTHHSSHEKPEALLPKQPHTVCFQLNECAHRLRAGHRLRLALSNSYWPMVWPAPKPVKLDLDLAECWLELPVRSAENEIDAMAPNDPINFPKLPSTVLRDTANEVKKFVLDDGTIIRHNRDDLGATRDSVHGLEVGSAVSTRYAIHPHDPASARVEAVWNFTFARGDWQVEIETENSMCCDSQYFYLHRNLRAVEGAKKTEVFTKEWSETVSRGLL